MSGGGKIVIKYRTPGGFVDEFEVGEILEINGRPYRSAEDFEGLVVDVATLSGRVQAVENLLANLVKG
jgi:hypothetical protein